MSKSKNHITCFEHEVLKAKNDSPFNLSKLEEMQLFYGSKGVPYFSLVNNGIKFCEYVGVLQVGNTVIEVLPKADKSQSEETWKEMLISMLRAVGLFDIHVPSSSSLKLKPNSVLDLYFELFIDEVEYLINKGLIKKYRKVEGNSYSLKGSLQFSKNIHHNLVHNERFYVRYTTLDYEHKLHFIIYKTIVLLFAINTNNALQSRLGALLLFFPLMKDIIVSERIFETITYDRKTLPYKHAIEIARLLLLRYHPDVTKGHNNVLALMFDMNLLWEKFVYTSIRKNNREDLSIKAQPSKYFWKPDTGKRTRLEPDIVITDNKTGKNYLIDTKWKNLNGNNPSPGDLRQMFAYHEYFSAEKTSLVYPGDSMCCSKGIYLDKSDGTVPDGKECSVMTIQVCCDVSGWQQEIYKEILDWIRS